MLRGSGLSSSAAFEVVIGAIFNGEFNAFRFTPVEIAQISQYAENVYFGKPSGLMDQTASSVGSAITIDFADPSSPIVEEVAFDLSQYGLSLCITDTKGSHADLTDDYAAIRSEMEQVAGLFGKKVLREVDEDRFFSEIARVRGGSGDRAVLRAIHFFAECHRAVALRDAVKAGDIERFKKLIIDGGHSSFEYNQNAYSIKHPKEQGGRCRRCAQPACARGRRRVAAAGRRFCRHNSGICPGRSSGTVHRHDGVRIWQGQLLCAERAQLRCDPVEEKL